MRRKEGARDEKEDGSVLSALPTKDGHHCVDELITADP